MDEFTDATPGEPPEASLHRPVLLTPLIQNLQPREGHVAVDGTLGGGGLTAALLDGVGATGRVLAIDRDPSAIARARRRFEGAGGERLILAQGDFAGLDRIAAAHGILAVDSISLDLGTSSLQLDDPARGFSFRRDGPLDMRMDQTEDTPTAAAILNEWEEADLVALIRSYGDERFATAIARAVIRERRQRPLATTSQLRELVEQTVPRRFWPKRIHPATRTFQALRIAVNDEFQVLDQFLSHLPAALKPGGRVAILSFHSGDPMVPEASFGRSTPVFAP